MEELSDGQGEAAGGDVVKHDAGAGGEAFELADGWGFDDVEESEEEQGERGMAPIGGDGDQGDELAGDLVDDDMAWVLTARFAGDDGGGGDADKCGYGCGYGRSDGQGYGRWVQEVGRSVPEQDGGDAAVGAGAGFEQACSEEGADKPGPEGLLFGGWMQLNLGVGHYLVARRPD